ncbi:uncharacterized protein LOC135836142 [Planococcus citri]|uniref:uncharacterized protein LOC135836142 n=1 Tax=Planococcus citri TaxID=170843 RepID=UPI0031F72AA4
MPIFIIYSSTLKNFESFSNLFLYGTICLCFCSGSFSYDDYTVQEGRGIVFPVFTVLQFAVGITVPTQIPNRTVVTNWGVLSNLPLPSKINQLYPYTVRGRQLTHDHLYEFLTTAWNWGTSDGKQCMLKTICQVSNMNSNNGELIFDVLRLLFSPSSLKYPIARTHYMIAEQRGKTSRSSSCAEMYPSCSHSIIDLLVLK